MAALGAHQTLIVTQGGRQLLVWGKNKRGRITLDAPSKFECPLIPRIPEASSTAASSPSPTSSSSPASPSSGAEQSWTVASCGFDHCCAVTDEGR